MDMDGAELVDIRGTKRIRCVAGAQYLYLDPGTTTTRWINEISLIPNSAERPSAKLMILRLARSLAFEWQIHFGSEKKRWLMIFWRRWFIGNVG